MKKGIAAACLAALCCAPTLQAEDKPDRFIGRVAIEWVDRPGREPAFVLREHVGFEEYDDTNWFARKGESIDGSSMPPAFRSMFGGPFSGQHRIAAILHDYYTDERREPWKDVHRMFYRVSHAAGVPEAEAKTMYMVLYAQAQRWEVDRSRCYGSCHGPSEPLVWRPVTDERDLHPVAEWIRNKNPTLDEIDRRTHTVIQRPGPHLFAQGRRG